MSEATEFQLFDRAAELRRAFDRTFVEAHHREAIAEEDFLSVEIGGDPYALRLTDIAGLHNNRKIAAVPSHIAELRGIAGFRGAMLPVYDLAGLLRYRHAESPRWLVVAARAPVGFALEQFCGHFRAPEGAVASYEGDQSRDHLHQILRTADFVRPIINVASLVTSIRERAQTTGLQKEH
jgi:chemotaxis signal transduction protein